ncbi:MAG: hypothetical protein A2Z06_00115 [Candidatus Glassbacteria bacterium RBG_16_58_8]|uniref:FlgD Ig-like domain-containing protein n=1 Tax=Candidatus Glassbacteria bacterium RBG_16_58_8 TaxID=1817866 RepID=A0A1F5YD55_9BACT|nr:MAG: hypothetical protein A2Z06_00115 [Candidatus Glassbacteria bacterium RBG_16_58_8]
MLEIRLATPREGDPPPVLSVRQWIRSDGGENLLDPFDEPIEWSLGVEENGPGVKSVPETVMSVPRPNPFRGSTTISLEVREGGRGTLAIYDLRGRRIRVLSDCSYQPGLYRLSWDGRDSCGAISPSGIYLVHFSHGGRAYRQKVVFLR